MLVLQGSVLRRAGSGTLTLQDSHPGPGHGPETLQKNKNKQTSGRLFQAANPRVASCDRTLTGNSNFIRLFHIQLFVVVVFEPHPTPRRFLLSVIGLVSLPS